MWNLYVVIHAGSFSCHAVAAMGEFANGLTSSTKIESSRVEYWVGKTSKTSESSTRHSSTFELDFWGRVFRVKLGNSEKNESSPSEIVKSSKLDLPSIFKLLELKNIESRVRHSRKNSPMAVQLTCSLYVNTTTQKSVTTISMLPSYLFTRLALDRSPKLLSGIGGSSGSCHGFWVPGFRNSGSGGVGRTCSGRPIWVTLSCDCSNKI